MKSVKFLLLIFIYSSFINSAFSSNTESTVLLDSAAKCYTNGEYQKAADYYQQVLNSGQEAGEVYYNLGNCYFKLNKIGNAILNYEKAKVFLPEDQDIENNLKMANQQIEDKIDVLPKLFLIQWKESFVTIFSESTWSVFCIISFVIALFFFAIFFLSSKAVLKRTGFVGGVTLILISFTIYVIAQQSYQSITTSANGVILSPSITVFSSPSEKGTKLFLLHEGTKMELLQTEDEWTEIRLTNGNVGWIKNNSYLPI
jgi:tetratricopeptide (TPR) repeat protein